MTPPPAKTSAALMEICLVHWLVKRFVACLFRSSSPGEGLHTLANEMDSGVERTELSPYSQELLDAVLAALPQWLTVRISTVASGVPIDTADVIQKTLRFVEEHLYALLATDVDAQRANPLHVYLRKDNLVIFINNRFSLLKYIDLLLGL